MDNKTIIDVEVLTRGERKVLWKELCEFLETRPRKCAYRCYVPTHLIGLLVSKSLKVERECYIFYSTGWGWRLRKNWRTNL